MRPCRVLVADERHILAVGLARLLEQRPAVLEASVLQEAQALPAALASGWDVVVASESFVDRVLRHAPARTRVLVAVRSPDAGVIARLLRRGAFSVCTTSDPADDVALAVEQTARGEMRLPPSAVRDVLDELSRINQLASEADDVLARLTDRERDVLVRLGRGSGRVQIARELGLSPHTVRTHVQHVLRKLKLHSQLEAAALARDLAAARGAQVGPVEEPHVVIDLDARRTYARRG